MASLTRQIRCNPARILIVEDNAAEVELTVRALEACGLNEGISIARDGIEALDFMSCQGKFSHRSIEERPHLVLLDLKLPLVDGFDVLRRMRTEPETRSVPVVALSASARECDVAAAYRFGANSYIVKPVVFNHFVQAMSLIVSYWLTLNRQPVNDYVAVNVAGDPLVGHRNSAATRFSSAY